MNDPVSAASHADAGVEGSAGSAGIDLDPLRFALHGSRLIEAGAGTGKTYTIAALYVRLVLGHGDEAAFVRPLTPPEILVVTFTEAATQELRERIRARLGQAARCFLADEDDPAPGDELLRALRADYPVAQWAGCARKLQLAAEWMDEAAVSTIHGWCNRMLREHAFDSDSLFTQTLEADQSELLGEVVRDYWRTFMVPLDDAGAAEVWGWWPGPAALYEPLRRLVGNVELLDAAPPPADALLSARDERQRRLREIKAPWSAWVGDLQQLLDSARDGKLFVGTRLRKNDYDKWLQALADWRDDAQRLSPGLSDAGRRRLTVGGLADVWKQPPAPRHAALVALEELDGEIGQLPDARQDVLRHAAHWVAERYTAEQQRRAQMGFDDLLTRFDDALHGANGERLAATIRQQFPAALIDEFQDTDPVQYRIFDAVYRVAANDAQRALILIGDPKQAIYAFRGADIQTYLAARSACAGRLYTLRRNFRSTAALVAATNRCFAMAEARAEGEGAFLFRRATDNPLPFVAAQAQGRDDRLQVAGADAPALTLCCLAAGDGEQTIGRGAYVERMAEACASEMVRLLTLGRNGQAGFVGAGAARGLRPADMAVLVNDRTEADAIRGALARRDVRSVYLSDKESVFASAQAAQMQLWLAACAEPDDARALRAALTTATLALSWAELDRLNHDEIAWEARVAQFRDYRESWRRQGVLPMLRRLLNDFGVPGRLLAANGAAQGGERVLTDLLHLAELLQQASSLLDGEHALIRFLAEQSRDAQSGAALDARKLRLESDADRVQVVTVHKSKGLEYPLVFLPFACRFREVDARQLPIKYHDDAGHLRLALSASDEVLAIAERERLGEDLRKFYVALTRARYATWLGVAPVDRIERSALGYLAGVRGAPGVDDLAARLAEWCGERAEHAELARLVAPAPDDRRYADGGERPASGGARQPRRAVGEHWWVASYSAIRNAGHSGGARPLAADTAADEAFAEAAARGRLGVAPPDAGVASAARHAVAGALHDFPRGAAAGSFLHELLEWIAGQGFATIAARPALLADCLTRRCTPRGWARWIAPLQQCLQDFLCAPLPLAVAGAAAGPMTLAGLAASRAEMEFWLATQRVDVAAIDALLRAHTLAAAPRPALGPGQLNGMLKGFIDLVFEHEGRYYVADYKSNWLGADDAAYTGDALRGEILAARYDLQYVLYLLALHRLLKSRRADYDYERHIGGAVYIFLRGLNGPERGVFVERPPGELITALDALFAGVAAGGKP